MTNFQEIGMAELSRMHTMGTMHPVGETELEAVEGGWDTGAGIVSPGVGPPVSPYPRHPALY